MLYNPIAGIPSIEGWAEVHVQECGELLIPIYGVSDKIIASPTQMMRQGVVEKLLEAARLLPNNMKLVVYRAWDDIQTQKDIYNEFKKTMRNKYPHTKEDALHKIIEQYVFPADISPYATGGSIDVSILHLDMGSDYGSFVNQVKTRHYEHNPHYLYSNNRRLLFNMMISVGFVNCGDKWWNFHYGNQVWGKLKREDAFYGIIDK